MRRAIALVLGISFIVKANQMIAFRPMRSRLGSFVSVVLSVGLVSCGGSTATPAPSGAAGFVSCASSAATPPPSSTSTHGSWQVILTVKTTGGGRGLGITGVTLDGQGNLYLAEFDDDLIYKYSSSGNLLAQWGGHGSGPGQLEAPDKLAFDPQGNLYVTEVGTGSSGGNSRIQKFSPTGMPLAQWGTFGSGPGQFNTAVGIAVDQQGDIYVADVAITGSRCCLPSADLSHNGTPLAAVQGSQPKSVTTSRSMHVETLTSQSHILLVLAMIGSRSSRPPESYSQRGEGLVRVAGS